jgi:uncharacterized protein (DUF302 family)
MSDYTLSKTVAQPYEQTVQAVKAGLADQGFGVLTEIDLAATLHAKIGATVPPQVILGACRPQLAYEALQADPSIATVLPCNVVVRTIDDTTTVVEAFDPNAMVGLSPTTHGPAGNESPLATVAADARQRLTALLDNLN